MRRQRFEWSYLVLSIVMCAYGGSLFIYNLKGDGGFPVGFLILFIVGLILIILYVIYRIYRFKNNRFKKHAPSKPVHFDKKEEIKEDKIEESNANNKKVDAKDVVEEKINQEKVVKRDYQYTSNKYDSTPSFYRREVRTVYINRMGYGPALRVEGNRIFDMRNGTYYRIDGYIVNQEGSGPIYEISSNRIRAAYGSYLYEISGNNINKIYGGFFASINGNILSTYDSSQRFEFDGSLSSKQILAVVAILFGRY